MPHKKRKRSKMNYMLRSERKAEQDYQHFQTEMQRWKKENFKSKVRINIGSIFILLYLITAIFIIVLVFKDTTMPPNVYNDIIPPVFFLCMLIGWILVAGIFYLFFHHSTKKLQKKAEIFIIIANIFMYSVWFELIFWGPFINMLHRIVLAMIILFLMNLAAHYLIQKIWRCPTCHMPLPLSKPGYRVLVGMPIDCAVCPHCKKAIE